MKAAVVPESERAGPVRTVTVDPAHLGQALEALAKGNSVEELGELDVRRAGADAARGGGAG
jgi:hypothetical protein